MTALQLEPSAQAPCTNTIFGSVFTSSLPFPNRGGNERTTLAPPTVARTCGAAHLSGGIEQPCLTDSKDQGTLVGSYTILTLGQQRLSLARDGNIPGRLFSSL